MTSTDHKPLYAKREPFFPRKVKGKFRSLKWGIMILTLGVYYRKHQGNPLVWARFDLGFLCEAVIWPA